MSTSPYAALRDTAFRRIFAASFVSQTGDWFQITGRALLVYQITGSAAALGVVYVASFAPMLLFTNVGGLIADRYDRRRVMITCQVLAMLGALAMAALAATDTATLLNVSVISVFLGLVMAVNAPANSALLPMIVEPEHLTSAISLNSSVNSGARVLGPLLAGLLLPLVGLTWLFLLNAVSFLFVIGAWAITRLARQERMSEHGAFAALRSSLRIARDVRPIRVALITAAVVGGVGQIYQPLAAAWATDTLADGAHAAGSRAYGLTQAAIGVGAVVGALLVARHHRRRGRTLWWTAAGTGLSLTALGLAGSLVPAAVVCAVMGLFQYGAMALCATTIQHRGAAAVRGRGSRVPAVPDPARPLGAGDRPAEPVCAAWLHTRRDGRRDRVLGRGAHRGLRVTSRGLGPRARRQLGQTAAGSTAASIAPGEYVRIGSVGSSTPSACIIR